MLAAGFDSVDAAKADIRARKKWMRAQAEMLAAEKSMSIEQLAAMLPEPAAPAPLPEAKVVRPFLPATRGALAVQAKPEEDDNYDWLTKSNEAMRRHRGLHLVVNDQQGWRSNDGDD